MNREHGQVVKDRLGRAVSVVGLAGGLAGLAALLVIVGVVLLSAGGVDLADKTSSVLSFVLAAVLAGVSLVVWFRSSVRRRRAALDARALAALQAGPEDHWLRSARGADARGGFFFTGRQDVLAELAALAEGDEPGLAVVLGMPGAGKSAVLGAVVVRSRSDAEMPDDVAARVPRLRIDCAVHARAKTVAEVVADLAAMLGVVVDATHGQEALFRDLQRRATRAVIVVDAMPSTRPNRPTTWRPCCRGCRGTRSCWSAPAPTKRHRQGSRRHRRAGCEPACLSSSTSA